MTVSPIVTAAGAWVWDKYSKSATEKTAKALKAAWEQGGKKLRFATGGK